MLHMWDNRVSLLQKLDDLGLGNACQTTKEQYGNLLMTEPWWNLLRMLKLKNLRDGLGLTIPREFSSSKGVAPTQCSGEDHPPFDSTSSSQSAQSGPPATQLNQVTPLVQSVCNPCVRAV